MVKRRLDSGGMAHKILSALETDGGWLTAAGISLVIPNTDPDSSSFRRGLESLTKRGCVTSRTRQLAFTAYGRSYPRIETRVEYRFREWPDA